MLPADDGLYEVEDSHRVTTSQSLFTTPYSSEGVFTQPQPSSTWRASKANKARALACQMYSLVTSSIS
ncbi:hypothetical protein EB796_014965 [Bugula neritina]|uniref:Uncharacterized protein n=1 Tax=Bugula neritina TaxID=10212 RepID=A0A7J7JLG9_BUGNE|nr:hypothetical protein EB796_014965 [Bugula neritina]